MKLLLAVVAIVATSLTTLAAGSGGATRPTIDGCGLGWEVTDSKTMMGTSTRGTTNAFVPPAFGMTSGTLGCEQLQFASNNKEAAEFVASNYETLKSELATGKGEYVNAMMESFGCSSQEATDLSAEIQSNYETIVAPANNATELYKNLESEISCLN